MVSRIGPTESTLRKGRIITNSSRPGKREHYLVDAIAKEIRDLRRSLNLGGFRVATAQIFYGSYQTFERQYSRERKIKQLIIGIELRPKPAGRSQDPERWRMQDAILEHLNSRFYRMFHVCGVNYLNRIGPRNFDLAFAAEVH
jgi:hypothetical protein